MRGSGSHESSGKFRRLFIGCCSSVYGNASVLERGISSSLALRGTALPGETLLMLCFNPDCSCCSGWCRKSTRFVLCRCFFFFSICNFLKLRYSWGSFPASVYQPATPFGDVQPAKGGSLNPQGVIELSLPQLEPARPCWAVQERGS